MRITAHVKSRKQELCVRLNLFQTPTPLEIAIPWFGNHFYPLRSVQTFLLLHFAFGNKQKEEEEEEEKMPLNCDIILN
jgi:hypothetical protein